MKLTEQQIIEVAKKSHPNIINLRNEAVRLKMNILGENYLNFLKQKQGLENEGQYNLRKLHSMSNRGIWSQLTQPFNSIYTAKGGSVSYYSKSAEPDKIKSKMGEYVHTNSSDHISLMQFTTDYFKNLLFTEPNGAVVVDRDGTGFRYTTLPISSITNFKRKSVNSYDFIVYREKNCTYKNKELNTIVAAPVYNIIDDYANYVVIKESGGYKIAPFDSEITYDNKKYKSYIHGFASCPVVGTSNFAHDDFENKQSPAWDSIELSEQLLDESSTKTAFKALHGYPYFWEYDLEACPDCHGEKVDMNGHTCPTCAGTGRRKKDVSNVKVLEKPEHKDDPTVAPNIAGYITPPIETWKQMDLSDEANADKLSKQLWGVVIDPIKNRTATGQIIDQQPVVRKLDEFSNAAELFINSFANLIGSYIYNDSFTEANIKLGDTYLILDPNALLKQYSDNVIVGNDALKTELLDNYYKHRYSKNPTAYLRKTKELKIEPYPHNSVAEIISMSVDQTTKDRKIYFTEWNNTVPNSDYIVLKHTDLIKKLDIFIEDRKKSAESL